MADTITTSIVGCARCHGDGHGDMTFIRLEHPVECGEHRFTHWAICPTNGEPILFAVIKGETTDG